MPIVNHLGLVVSDVQRSKRFYEDVLGFRLWYEDASLPDETVAKLLGLEPPLGAQICYLTLDNYVLELIAYGDPGARRVSRERTMAETGLSHLSVSVDDIPATAEKAVQYGGAVVESSNLGVALMIRDPDGQLIELLTTDYPKSRPAKPPSSR